MRSKYHCPRCGQPIETSALASDETVICPHCGSPTVVSDVERDKRTSLPDQATENRIKMKEQDEDDDQQDLDTDDLEGTQQQDEDDEDQQDQDIEDLDGMEQRGQDDEERDDRDGDAHERTSVAPREDRKRKPINGKDLQLGTFPVLVLDTHREMESPTPQGRRNLLIILAFLLIVLAAGLLLYTRFLPPSLGERISFDPEEIFYTEGATEEDARRLGEYLGRIGTFDGQTEKTVVLARNSGGYALKFIIREEAFDERDLLLTTFEILADRISANVFGGSPVTIHLCDGTMEIRGSVSGSGARWIGEGTGDNEIFLRRQATSREGEALASYFGQIGLFTGDSRTSIVLSKESGRYFIQFVFVETAWADETEILASYSTLARMISANVFEGLPVSIHLADADLEIRATVNSDGERTGDAP